MKKIFAAIVVVFGFASLSFAMVSQEQCQHNGDNFIFAGGECIQFAAFNGDTSKTINIIVHGTWDAGTNTIGRYAPFAETLSMNTDITTIAVALPGYSGSSTNHLKSLSHGGGGVYSPEYIDFIAALVKEFKAKYNAETINYMGHSAGASLGANLIAKYPGVVSTLTAVGGRYDLDKFKEHEQKQLYSIGDNLDKVGDTKILLVYGTEDKISEPKVTVYFYEKAKKAGLHVSMVEAKGAAHLDLDMADASVDAFTAMVAE
jgi:pimeloyl-ACP methyl ester carboxylesterase